MSEFSNQTGENPVLNITNAEIPLPPECKVIFYNDDKTTMEFVVDVLKKIFNKSPDAAEYLMQTVHNNGSAVVGTYTYDIAASRASLTIKLARKQGFPLRVEIE